MRLSLRLTALLAGLSLSGGVAAACGNHLEVALAAGQMNEHTRFGELYEDGPWGGIGGQLARPTGSGCLTLAGSLHGGVADYDGFTQVGAPHETVSNHQLWRVDGGLRVPAGERYALQGLLGVERFVREVQPNDGLSGITEVYTFWWMGLGAEAAWCASCRVAAVARVRADVALAGGSDVDLGNFGTADIDLEDAARTRGELELQPRGARWSILLYREDRDVGRSGLTRVDGPVPLTVFQPAFDLDETGVALRWALGGAAP